MAERNSGEQSASPSRTFGQRAKQAGLFLLFGTILVIPRIRRLRRRVWAWTCVRLVAGTCGVWLIWQYARARVGLAPLALGLLILAFGLMVRAKPETKPVDALARELSALIVLNGGTFQQSSDSVPIRQAEILVRPEHILVLGPHERRLLEIPLAKVRGIVVSPVANGAGKNPGPWEVEINWMSKAPCKTTFHYNGPFAEHLARVTESTLCSQWKKELPVIPR